MRAWKYFYFKYFVAEVCKIVLNECVKNSKKLDNNKLLDYRFEGDMCNGTRNLNIGGCSPCSFSEYFELSNAYPIGMYFSTGHVTVPGFIEIYFF